MKQINTYINEKLKLTSKRTYTYYPEDKKELRQIIIERIKNEGPTCDLNDIDVSKITDMSNLFDVGCYKIFRYFDGDISMWNVSNVRDMSLMFWGCKNFNCDISRWNVSNVINMNSMFSGCTKFNQDLKLWNVSNVQFMLNIFKNCKSFNCDLSSWNVSKVIIFGDDAFENCPTQPEWYINKNNNI